MTRAVVLPKITEENVQIVEAGRGRAPTPRRPPRPKALEAEGAAMGRRRSRDLAAERRRLPCP